MLQEQQEAKIKGSYSKENAMVEENVPGKAESEEHVGFSENPTELFPEDEEIYKRLNIPWLPNEMQATAGNKAFDSEKREFTENCKTV